MAVDITLLFKASVKTVKTRNKALGVPAGESARDELLKRGSQRPKSDFSGRAREVITNIGKLKDFLLQHRKDYINAYSHLMSDYMRMTDTERDQIDQDAQIFMRTCADAIQQLRTEAHKDVQSSQVKEHRTAVLDFIEDYLKRVCKLYSEQRAIRVKRMVDKKRLSRLEPEQNNKAKALSSSEKILQNSSEESEEKPACEENKDQNLPEDQTNFALWRDGKGEDELSPEEIQMFEQENQRLVGEMNSLFDEVRQIEGKVVEISRLQEIFTEKVLQQDTEIDNIHQLVVGATENIKEGNEDIREATSEACLISNNGVSGSYLDHLHRKFRSEQPSVPGNLVGLHLLIKDEHDLWLLILTYGVSVTSQAIKKKRWISSMDPFLPCDVFVFFAFPGLV